MSNFAFTIRLVSDAEPGTGLGGELVNELVPRDHHRRPIIPGSHIKGLMRRQLNQFIAGLGWPDDDEIRTAVFGGDKISEDDGLGIEAAFHVTDAVADQVPTLLVSRTSVDEETGGAADTSLRTTESIPVGTTFRGTIYSSAADDSAINLAWRAALLSVSAVGGNRSRGSGSCIVEVDNETRTPGTILKSLDQAVRQSGWKDKSVALRMRRKSIPGVEHAISNGRVALRLVFEAKTPICCPEIPDRTNVISTGFSIPASAVQGAILNRINRANPELASGTYQSPQFRAWPLLPCWFQRNESENAPATLPTAVRVSLTHRVAKFSSPDGPRPEDFHDEAFEPYDWKKVADGAPLKAADGVLLRGDEGDVLLWKAAAMPHLLTAHGVHGDQQGTSDGRDLFTIDSMAPMVWQGIVVVPQESANWLLESLDKDPIVPIGKSRSVRGLGELKATVMDGVPTEWQTLTDRTVLVVQSPLVLPDQSNSATAEEEFQNLVKDWTSHHKLPAPRREDVWADVGIRFGWNRHEAGQQQARRVILPGSVVAFDSRLDAESLAKALQAGIGNDDARKRGFGAVSVHPGKAKRLFECDPIIRPLRCENAVQSKEATELVLSIARKSRLPSASQVRAVEQHLRNSGPEQALKYLEQQTKRTTRIWFTWEEIHNDVRKLLKEYSQSVALRALTVLANLAANDGQRETRK